MLNTYHAALANAHWFPHPHDCHPCILLQERLFEQLSQLLNAALGQAGPARSATVQQLVCKVEEIHTTLRKHLAKEEEQLFPLLLCHFSHAEQVQTTSCSTLMWIPGGLPRQLPSDTHCYQAY